MPRVILMGPPGAGKGTQGEILAESWQVPRIAPGDIFRAEIKQGSELGLKVKSFSDSGTLVPDAVVIEVIESRLRQPDTQVGWILDGFPRTVAQSEALDNLLHQKKTSIGVVLAMQVSEEELVKRLLNRGLTSGRSDDNSEEVVRARIVEYHKKTSVVADYYRKFDKVVEIKGEGSVEEIFLLLCSEIDKRLSN